MGGSTKDRAAIQRSFVVFSGVFRARRMRSAPQPICADTNAVMASARRGIDHRVSRIATGAPSETVILAAASTATTARREGRPSVRAIMPSIMLSATTHRKRSDAATGNAAASGVRTARPARTTIISGITVASTDLDGRRIACEDMQHLQLERLRCETPKSVASFYKSMRPARPSDERADMLACGPWLRLTAIPHLACVCWLRRAAPPP